MTPPLRISETTSSIVTINVADEKNCFIHKNLLTAASKYFRAAFERDFQEAKDGSIRLTEVDVKTFDIFVDWLYTSELHVQEVKPNNLSLNSSEHDDNQFKENVNRVDELVSLYIFGDAHEIPRLCRVALDALFDHTTDPGALLPGNNIISLAFSKLPSSSLCLSLLVDLECRFDSITAEGESEEAEKLGKQVPHDFLRRLCARQKVVMKEIRMGTRKPCYALNVCDYHGHANENERNECSRNPSKSKSSG